MSPSAQPEKNQSPSRHEVWKMFDRIAPRYDLLNRLLSLGRDVSWRKKVARHLPDGPDLTVLDLATGTGDLLISTHQHSGRVGRGIGMDMATEMLKLASRKIDARQLSSNLSVMVGDARRIPLSDASCDAVTIAFGIRNVDPVESGLAEMHRVLNHRGKALILEFSLPENRLLRWFYLLYFRYVLPLLGSLISGDRQAYRYLNRTVETFPYGEDFCRLMEKTGFKNVTAHRLTFGIATIYEGTRGNGMAERTVSPLREETSAMTFNDAIRSMAGQIDTLLSSSDTTAPIARITIPLTGHDPLAWLAHQPGDTRIYWADRTGAFEMAAVGAADMIDHGTEQSLADIIKTVKDCLSDADPDVRYYGGSRFNHDSPPDSDWQSFGAARFVLPRFELIKTPPSVLLAVNLIPDNDRPHQERILSELHSLRPAGDSHQSTFPSIAGRQDMPDREGWSKAVESAYAAFHKQQFEKIVLARKTKLTLNRPLDPLLLLSKLRHAGDACYIFYFQFHPDRPFLGATPERLYTREGSRLMCDAIAGTRPRGSTDEEDRRLGEELMGSAKDQREQQMVVDSLAKALNPLCDSDIDPATKVDLLKLARVQHLMSRIDVTLKPGVSDDTVITTLHPTAAVGGLPKAGVIDEISNIEPFDRGWYAGPIGWLEPGRAEFAVAIRSALIAPSSVNLYAGAGILEGSRAESEWNELEDKISAMMEAITG